MHLFFSQWESNQPIRLEGLFKVTSQIVGIWKTTLATFFKPAQHWFNKIFARTKMSLSDLNQTPTHIRLILKSRVWFQTKLHSSCSIAVIYQWTVCIMYKKICSKRLTDCSYALHIHSKYISICSSIRQLKMSILRPMASVQMVWCLFCSFVWKEKIALVVSPVSQYSSWNVTTHIYVTKSWDKWLTRPSF